MPAWLPALLLAAATVALFSPALHCGFVNYDDDRYVTANPQVQGGLTPANIRWAFTHPVADNWHPLTVLSDMFICQFWGLNPWWHHLANMLLHAVNAALVFLLLRQWTGAVWKSLMVAALFAFHPLRVESVAWIAERKDVLSGFFGLLSLMAYTRYATCPSTWLRSPAYWLAWLWLACGLMSKPMLVTWPFLFLLLDYWPLKRLTPARAGQLILEKVPFLALAAATGIVTFLIQPRGAAVETMEDLPLTARCANALIACCRYLGKTIWPADLAVLYPHPGHWPATDVIAAGVLLAAASVLVVMQRRRRPWLLTGWFWFLGCLVPVIGLVQVGLQSLADRYTYMPSIGLFILVVWCLGLWAGIPSVSVRHDAREARAPGPWLLGVGGGLAIALCAWTTRAQLRYWQDGETLFRHTVEVTKNNFVACYNLGVALDQKNRPEEAIFAYQAALKIAPDYARARVNLGCDLDVEGRSDEAMQQYQQAIAAAPGNFYAHDNFGIALLKHGRSREAVEQLREAVRLAPDNAQAHNSLAAALYTDGQPAEAVQQFHEAIRLDPNDAQARFNLGCVLEKSGRISDAAEQFQEAVRINPDYQAARDHLTALSQQAR
jgi:Flp pilus assembly protein TadD